MIYHIHIHVYEMSPMFYALLAATYFAISAQEEEYPYFLRTLPPDSLQAAALWSFILEFQVPAAVVLCADLEPFRAIS